MGSKKGFIDWVEKNPIVQTATQIAGGLADILDNYPYAAATKKGIPKDPNYKRSEPFFKNLGPKYNPLTPLVPIKQVDHGWEKWPEIDTADGKMKPSQIHDQYLKNVEGGGPQLVKETQANYERDKGKLPWKMDPEARNIPVPVTTDTAKPSQFDSSDKTININPHTYPSKDTEKLFHGLPAGHPGSSFMELLTHEMGHAATTDTIRIKEASSTRESFDQLSKSKDASPDGLKNPYYLSSSEEYKTGVLSFLNKSRQLTGCKFTNPQDVHQLFDEIKKNPSILEQNYSPEEARLPRTFLLLEKVNPEGAETLRNATARDGQYLSQVSQERANLCQRTGSLRGPSNIPTDCWDIGSKIANPSTNITGGLAKLQERMASPIEPWLNKMEGKEMGSLQTPASPNPQIS